MEIPNKFTIPREPFYRKHARQNFLDNIISKNIQHTPPPSRTGVLKSDRRQRCLPPGRFFGGALVLKLDRHQGSVTNAKTPVFEGSMLYISVYTTGGIYQSIKTKALPHFFVKFYHAFRNLMFYSLPPPRILWLRI